MDNCRSFAGARANKDGHREPEPASLGHIIGFHQRRARKYRIFCIIQKRKEKIEERRRRKIEKKGPRSWNFYFVHRPRSAGTFFSSDFFISRSKTEKKVKHDRIERRQRQIYIYMEWFFLTRHCFLKNSTFIALSNFPLSSVISTLETK